MIPIERPNVSAAIRTLLTDPRSFFEYGGEAIDQKQGDTIGRFGSAFLTNIFGHFIIVINC